MRMSCEVLIKGMWVGWPIKGMSAAERRLLDDGGEVECRGRRVRRTDWERRRMLADFIKDVRKSCIFS